MNNDSNREQISFNSASPASSLIIEIALNRCSITDNVTLTVEITVNVEPPLKLELCVSIETASSPYKED